MSWKPWREKWTSQGTFQSGFPHQLLFWDGSSQTSLQRNSLLGVTLAFIHPEIQGACQWGKIETSWEKFCLRPVLLTTGNLPWPCCQFLSPSLEACSVLSLTFVCSFPPSGVFGWWLWSCPLLVFSLDSELCQQKKEKDLFDPESFWREMCL